MQILFGPPREVGVATQGDPEREPRWSPARAHYGGKPALDRGGTGRTFPVSQAWRARARCRACWGCCSCRLCLEPLESAAAPIWGHTQVPARAAGGRLGPPGRGVLSADGCASIRRTPLPGRSRGHRTQAAAATQGPARAGPGRSAAFGGAVHCGRRGFCAVQVFAGAVWPWGAGVVLGLSLLGAPRGQDQDAAARLPVK